MGKATSVAASQRVRWGTLTLFIAPALVMFVAFLLGPLIWIVGASFFTWTITNQGPFAGLQNYIDLFTIEPYASQVTKAFFNNVAFFVGIVVLQNVIGLGLAALIQRLRTKWRRFFQILFVAPYLISPLIIGYLWVLLLSPYFGPVASFLRSVGLDSLVHPWLGSPDTAFPTIILIGAWQWMGFPVLLYCAALGGIPHELDEAARVDGASSWRRFFSISLPLLTPTIGTVTILTFIASMEIFALVYAIAGPTGTPAGATDVLGLLFYRTSFQAGASNAIGHSSALGVLLLFVVLGGAILAQRLFLRIERSLS